MGGKGISKQLYNILDKIRAVDALQAPWLQDQLFEMSPELSFAELTGRPMAANKRTVEGRTSRRQALASASHVRRAVSGSSTGRRPSERSGMTSSTRSSVPRPRGRAAGLHMRLGGDTDTRGLRMEIIA